MARQIINTGQAPNDGTGDQLYIAFDKVNGNSEEIYTAGPVGTSIQIQDNIIRTIPDSLGNVDINMNLVSSGTGTINILSNTVIGDVTKTLVVNSSTNFVNDVAVTGTLTANSTVIMSDTLNVTGTTTLSTLITTGLANVNSLSTVTDANIGSTLDVTGATTVTTLIATDKVSILGSSLVLNDGTDDTVIVDTATGDLTTIGLISSNSLNVTGTASAATPDGSLQQELVTVEYFTNNSGGGGGLPIGGGLGQLLAKIDSVDFNTEWIKSYKKISR